jgi:hypothetical protein
MPSIIAWTDGRWSAVAVWTTLVRRESAVADYANLGVETVVGSLDDASVITDQVAVSDIVFHTATADHLPSVQAIIDGIRPTTVSTPKLA